MPARGVAEYNRPGAVAGANGVNGGPHLPQDVAEAHRGGEVVGGDGEADALTVQDGRYAAEPASTGGRAARAASALSRQRCMTAG